MATFVLVHAAWGGGWEWGRVRRSLAAQAHQVFTPTLTGLGERAHLASPDVGLSTHIDDVVAVLESEDLREVVLTGHSSSGMVITGAMDRAPERISHGVYIDAVVPRDGQSLADLVPPTAVDELVREPAARQGDGWLVPVPFGPDELDMSDEDAAWYLAHVVPTPLKVFEEPITLTGRWASVPAFTYVHCTKPSTYLPKDAEGSEGFVARFARQAQRDGWNYREIEAGHDPHITAPELLAAVLDEIAES